MSPTMLPAQHMCDMDIFHVDSEITATLKELSDEDLASFAELHQDASNDEQIEIYILSCFLIFTRTCSVERVEQAIQRTEAWIAASPTDHPDRSRRFQILDEMLARLTQDRFMLEDAIQDAMPNIPGVR